MAEPLVRNGGYSPREEGDVASISLTQYYLKNTAEERKTAPNDQDEFMKTLNQMETEDVPQEEIEQYRKAEILRKSMAVVKKHAQRMEDIRTSPERYDRVKGKVSTKNPFAANLSSVNGSRRTMYQTGISGYNNNGLSPSHNHQSLIREENSARKGGRAMMMSPTRTSQAGAGGDEDWYKPELGDIPLTHLTKANREKIELRDREIEAKELELK